MDAFRILRVYGHKQPNTQYTVTVNGMPADTAGDGLFSFTTNTKLHGSCTVSVKVDQGSITLTHGTATYPAIYNGTVSGTVTIDQPIDRPIVVINKTVEFIPFDITIKQGQVFDYEHMLFNGPTRFRIATVGIDLMPNLNIHIGNLRTKEFIQGVVDVQTDYEYQQQPNMNTVEDLEKLKSLVSNKLTCRCDPKG